MDNQHSKFQSFKYLFFALIIIGVFLRVYKLGIIPLSLSRDEASIGYNSWLVGKTGKDEWGEAFPLHFRAFGEWKLPGYIYLSLPIIKFFGLNIFSVRMLSALAGLASGFIWYFIWKEKDNKTTGIISGLLILFSFWNFSLSRAGFEVNLATAFFLLGWWLWQGEKHWLSIIPFLGTIYTYNAFRIVTPLFLTYLFAKHFYKTKNFKKLLVLVLFGISCLPVVYFSFKEPTAFLRAQQTGIQNLKATTVVSNYFNHFNPTFLLFNGDNNLRHFPGMTGQISFLVLGLALVGLFKLDLNGIILLLIGPLPAVITKQSPHGLRSIGFMVAVFYLAGLGVIKLKQVLEKKNLKAIKVLIISGFLIACIQYIYFYYDYFTAYPQRSLSAWKAGYKQVYEKIKDIDQEIYFSWEYNQPYIYKLFYDHLNIFKQDVDVAPPSQWHLSRVTRINNIHYLSCSDQKELFQSGPAYFILTPDCDLGLKSSQIKDKVLINNQLRFIIANNFNEK